MFAPAHEIASVDSGVQAELGNPPRFYSFGEAPEKVTKPYAVWQVIGGSPENYIAGRPDSDQHVVQVDVYAEPNRPQDARAVTVALVTAFELRGNVTSWNGEFIDPDTKLRRLSFTVEFITPR